MPKNNQKTRKSIILIEDSHSMTLLISALFQRTYSLTSFKDVPSAWNWMKIGREADLIIIDYRLPVINGFEFAKYLSVDSLYKNVPVLVITGAKPTELPQDVSLDNISQIIHKPFDPQKFQKIVFETSNQVHA